MEGAASVVERAMAEETERAERNMFFSMPDSCKPMIHMAEVLNFRDKLDMERRHQLEPYLKVKGYNMNFRYTGLKRLDFDFAVFHYKNETAVGDALRLAEIKAVDVEKKTGVAIGSGLSVDLGMTKRTCPKATVKPMDNMEEWKSSMYAAQEFMVA